MATPWVPFAALAVLLLHCQAILAEESIKVEVVGTIRGGLVAIGGETTGTTITAKGVTWELDFGDNAEWKRIAEEHNGEIVEVQGTFEVRAGVEVRRRSIVSVKALRKVGGAAGGDGPAAGISARARREGSRVLVAAGPEGSVLDIHSRFGIDSATVVREGDEWPLPMIVRLHLKGLESFRAKTGEFDIEWSVSSVGENPARVSLRDAGGKETSLKKGHPLYSDAKIVGGGGKIPLRGGHFEVALPAKLFESNPEQITLSWIDFYRR